jgi:hypothetical protein
MAVASVVIAAVKEGVIVRAGVDVPVRVSVGRAVSVLEEVRSADSDGVIVCEELAPMDFVTVAVGSALLVCVWLALLLAVLDAELEGDGDGVGTTVIMRTRCESPSAMKRRPNASKATPRG